MAEWDRAIWEDISTDPFKILEPRNQEIGEFYDVQEHRPTDFEAPILRNDRSGYVFVQYFKFQSKRATSL